MSEYEWVDGSRFKVPAQIVGETVERISAREGVCPPGRLVEEARDVDSPLHPAFTWQDPVAAESWRRQEARQLINSVRIVVDDTPTRAPAFVHIRVGVAEGYASTSSVMIDPEGSEFVIAEARAALNGLRRRYSALKQLQPVWDAIDAIDVSVAS